MPLGNGRGRRREASGAIPNAPQPDQPGDEYQRSDHLASEQTVEHCQGHERGVTCITRCIGRRVQRFVAADIHVGHRNRRQPLTGQHLPVSDAAQQAVEQYEDEEYPGHGMAAGTNEIHGHEFTTMGQ